MLLQERAAQAHRAPARGPVAPFPYALGPVASGPLPPNTTSLAVPAATRPAPVRVSVAPKPLPVSAFPRPPGDNGRGMHWVPTVASSPDVVDRFVAEAKAMSVKWMVILNDGARVGANDYLVRKLTEAGIEPVMRIYTAGIRPIPGDLEAMVRHYVALGVHYFQPFNEPNLRAEYAGGAPSVSRYLDQWLPAARSITRAGGLPGFGSLAPGGDIDDVAFLHAALQEVKRRNATDALDRAWLSAHNYAHNGPTRVDDADSANGSAFFRFRVYEDVLRSALGREMPVLGTEGGAYVGDQQEATRPANDEARAVTAIQDVYRYMRDERAPWHLAYSYWVIANEAGGGRDPGFAGQALFRVDGSVSPLVAALRNLR